MRRSYPLLWTNKMRGGLLAVGIGTLFLLTGTIVLDPGFEANGFYFVGASGIVVGIVVFLRDYRVETKRRRHIRSKGHRTPKDWNPKIGVSAHRDPSVDTFDHKKSG